MPTKAEMYAQMAEKVAVQLTGSWQEWAGFLKMCIRDRDMIGHDPHELAAYLSAVLQGYTRESAQAELERIFAAQYQLTLTCLLYTSLFNEWMVRDTSKKNQGS